MSDDDDKVGYKRPPKQHRFKPGQSGNRRGRPRKKWRALLPDQHQKDLLEIADELVEVRTPSGPRKLTMHQVILRGVAAGAAKGKRECLKYWMDEYGAAVRARYERYPEVSLTDLLIRIAEDPTKEPDQLLCDTIEAQLKAIKNLY